MLTTYLCFLQTHTLSCCLSNPFPSAHHGWSVGLPREIWSRSENLRILLEWDFYTLILAVPDARSAGSEHRGIVSAACLTRHKVMTYDVRLLGTVEFCLVARLINLTVVLAVTGFDGLIDCLIGR